MAMVQPREDASENDDERSLRRQMVDVGASLSRVQYQLVKLGVVLDRSGEWTADGALSCAHWIAEALDVEVSAHAPTGYELPEPDFSLRAFRDDILPRLGDPELALVDVRSPAEFNGEIIAPPGMSETAQRAGHIPGAASIPWAQTVREDGTFKSAEELAALYGAKGITPDKDIIAYCRIGERSSHSWFVLHELLGYQRVRNYDGSWTEYGSLIGVPIEKPMSVAAG